MTFLDTGTYSAKRERSSELVELMRGIIADNPNATRKKVVDIAVDIIETHEDSELLVKEAVRYALNNVYNRVIKKRIRLTIDMDKAVQNTRDLIIESGIKLWSWRVPVVGKLLPNCTFAELAEAAPTVGRFLAKLSTQGAPGTLVREVYKTEKQLQLAWNSLQ